MKTLALFFSTAVILTAQPLAMCVSCHGEFENPAVVLQKRAAIVDAILMDKMPPGRLLGQLQKKSLLDDVNALSKIAEKYNKKKPKAKSKNKKKTTKS